ncbi:rod shape-determining protein MreC [Clostridium acidisoli DSM 12555]|uniref:Cell shape-determining protein MreC n=1 Tax=Clostridium acidisoli DSM 12555 TaxID=1121291 RepID=A0A1W1X5F2_9CLOT|nr:rod shape-determining protein MreC [Clostridium acidisoli]SMC19142.1 rod shape-determining protein MreC [Clostridium acidisoli DSM 12555]
MKLLKNKLAVAIIVLSVSFLVLIGVSVRRENASFLESGVGGAITSVQGVIYRASNKVADWFSFVTHFSEIKQENEDLKSQNSSMKRKVSDYDALKNKYDILSKKLNYQDQNTQYNYKNCNVIGRVPQNNDSIIIDMGTKDGIKIGLAVITEDGLVGKVIDVKSTYSIVGTLSNVNISVGAMNKRSRDNSGIVSGYEDDNNNKLAIIKELPQNADIKKDDEIITYGTVYPANIPIGKVISVGKDAATVSTTAVIKPHVDFNKLEQVSVVVPKNNDVNEIKY